MNKLIAILLITILSSAFTSRAKATEPFIGELRTVGFNFCPRGWAAAEGQLLAISSNSALFSLLGTMYGGDGRTTFALPDLRGRTVIGAGSGPGLSPRTQGAKAGVETVTLATNQMPSHSHGFSVKQGRGVKTAASGSHIGEAGIYRTNGATLSLNSSSISNTGGSQPHENMPPYIVLKTCIALQGIFPSRN